MRRRCSGGNPRILKSGNRSADSYQDLWSTISSGGEWRGEFCNRRKNGEEFWELASISPVRAQDGEITHFIAVKQDITELRALATQLRQAQKLEAIGQLAAGIAHEINTPTQFIGDNLQFLGVVVGRLELLLESCGRLLGACRASPSPPEGVLAECERAWKAANVEFLRSEIPEALSQSQAGIQRITHIVQAMRDFSHPGTEEKTQVDLNRLVDSTLTVSRNEWKYVADLQTDFDPALCAVPCLPGDFNQVILNLVVNAAHAMGQAQSGGRSGKGLLRVVTRAIGGWAEVRISDTGCGIPEEIRERVFEPFFTTKAVGRGTGQGLAIARSVIVDKHGGSLAFDSEVGRGTTFIVRIPLVLPETPSEDGVGHGQDPGRGIGKGP